ncbi:MAG: hypothetical protein IKQ49_06505 [Eubacterium sp.]|nr:hypothetical protein [Eubacterium sp.]
MRKHRKLAAMLSFAMAVSAIPAAGVFAAEDDRDVLLEMAEQMQDETVDSFSYREEPQQLHASEDADYPSCFDLRNVDTDGDGEGDTCYVTPVKFQNPFGTCWGFSAIAYSEISILGNPDLQVEGINTDTLDLSEKHLAWFAKSTIDDPDDPQYGEGMVYRAGKKDGGRLSIGGRTFFATGLFASGMGPVMDMDTSSDGEEYYGFRYHGKEKLVDYGILDENGKFKRDENGDRIISVAPESDPPEGMTPFCYSASDDWSIDDQYKWYQSYKLKESFILPSPANTEGEEREKAINAIKEQLVNIRGVGIGFSADNSSPSDTDGSAKETKYLSNNWAHYTYDDSRPNHAVTIVGWDDNYPKENFRHPIKGMSEEEAYALSTPEHDGAWLVKNSWGSSERDFPDKGPGWGAYKGQDVPGSDYEITENVQTGYFWISYDDKSVSGVEAVSFDQVTTEDYLIYQHDYMPVVSVNSAYLSDETKMANVFEADEDGRIRQVSCQTTAPGTKVHYEVYRLNGDAGDPADGTLLAELDRTYKYGGFHKETLEEAPAIRKGQRFSVVVTQITPDDKYTISIQESPGIESARTAIGMGMDVVYTVGVINKGESLFYAGGKWNDLSEKWLKELMQGEKSNELEMDNFPIKAYVSEEDLPDEPEPPYVEPEEEEPEDPAFTAPTAKDGLFYTGYAQELIRPGSTEDGTMLYALTTDGKTAPGAEKYGKKIPSATEPGTYYVWYKVAGDKKHRDTEAECLTVQILLGKWVDTEEGRKYADSKGWYVKNQWLRIDEKWYFFDQDGIMETDAFREGWYLKEDGSCDGTGKKAGWRKDAKGWWYSLRDGEYLKDTWQKIDGRWYYFKKDGYMAQNEYVQGYWLGNSGAWTYRYKASWKKDKTGWYYSDPAGWYAKNRSFTIDGKKYTFDAKGYCVNP